MTPKTPPGQWSQSTLASLLGLTGQAYGRYLNAQSYPTLQTIQKFEAVFGWPASEQVQLIPPYWTWPNQSTGNGRKRGEPADLRYSMMLRKIVREWCDANPRVGLSVDIRQHPAIPARAGRGNVGG